MTVPFSNALASITPHSARLAIIAIIVAVLHHVDHVLRVDHSGFPFISEFTAFDISIIVAYPILFFVLFARGKHWLKFWLVTGGYVATQITHILLETPVDQYTVWATNASIVPQAFGQPNLLNLASPPLGIVSAGISLLLSFFLIALMISLYVDAQAASAQKQATA